MLKYIRAFFSLLSNTDPQYKICSKCKNTYLVSPDDYDTCDICIDDILFSGYLFLSFMH